MRKLISFAILAASLAALALVGRALAKEVFLCMAPVFDASVLVGR